MVRRIQAGNQMESESVVGEIVGVLTFMIDGSGKGHFTG